MGKSKNQKNSPKKSNDHTKLDAGKDKQYSSETVKNSHGESEVAKLRLEVEQLRKTVELMQVKLRDIEAKEAVTSQVNSVLANEVDRLEQYGRRHSVIIKGLDLKDKEDNASLSKRVQLIISNELDLPEEVKQIDKLHRIGPIYDANKDSKTPRQDVIVRFNNHSSRYSVYHKRKTLKNKKIRITPSLTDKRRKLLNEARSKYSDHDEVNFVYCDEHGDLKVRLNNPIEKRYAFKFRSIKELEELISDEEMDSNVAENEDEL